MAVSSAHRPSATERRGRSNCGGSICRERRRMMFPDSTLTTGQVMAAFSEAIAGCGGAVTDTFDDGRRLFTRSLLPHVEEVRPKDGVQGGVALKATTEE